MLRGRQLLADALLLSLPQSLWLTVLVRGNLLLVDGAGSSVGGNTGINPAHWSLVDSEVGDSLGGRGHVEGIGDGLSRSYRGIARIHGFTIQCFLTALRN